MGYWVGGCFGWQDHCLLNRFFCGIAGLLWWKDIIVWQQRVFFCGSSQPKKSIGSSSMPSSVSGLKPLQSKSPRLGEGGGKGHF